MTVGRAIRRVIFAGLMILAQRLWAAEGVPAPSATTSTVAAFAATNLALKPVGPGIFELGLVRLDQRRRTVRFPAVVNQKEGGLEYLVVAATGKTHESLLRTEARPQDIQLAFLLLGAKGAGTNGWPEDPAKTLPGDPVEIELSWKEDGIEKHRAAEEFVLDLKTGAAAKRGPWTYNGSRFREDGFAAQLDGSIISLIADADALVNNPRPGREDDDRWQVRKAGLPPVHSPVEVSIRLSQ